MAESNAPTARSYIEALPLELRQKIFLHLPDKKDVLNLALTSSTMHAAFKGFTSLVQRSFIEHQIDINESLLVELRVNYREMREAWGNAPLTQDPNAPLDVELIFRRVAAREFQLRIRALEFRVLVLRRELGLLQSGE
ncbi:hypothetical protein F5B20DRAFT_581504 [Whalleya microplaca]|nr:hypothetical protein F5B20DRAFT_581504 [Whalleya microplaca]